LISLESPPSPTHIVPVDYGWSHFLVQSHKYLVVVRYILAALCRLDASCGLGSVSGSTLVAHSVISLILHYGMRVLHSKKSPIHSRITARQNGSDGLTPPTGTYKPRPLLKLELVIKSRQHQIIFQHCIQYNSLLATTDRSDDT